MTRVSIYAQPDDHTGPGDKPALLGWFDPARAERFGQGREWDGSNLIGVITGSQWIDESLYRTAGGKWIRNYDATRYHNGPDVYEFLDGEQARDWLLRSGNDEAVERFFGAVAEEEDRRPGRPEVGGRVNTRLGDLLPRVDEWGAAHGISRAEAIRELVQRGLG